MSKKNLMFLSTGLLGILLVFDQFTKYLAKIYLQGKEAFVLIPNVLEFRYLENNGAAWGILQNQTILFIIITSTILILLTLYYIRIPLDKKYYLFRITIILLNAGALGNFIDRICNKYVVDFIYFKLINFPIFNIADSFVSISAVLLIYCILFRYKEEELVWKKNKQ